MSRGAGGEQEEKLIFDLHTFGPVQVAKNARFWHIHRRVSTSRLPLATPSPHPETRPFLSDMDGYQDPICLLWIAAFSGLDSSKATSLNSHCLRYLRGSKMPIFWDSNGTRDRDNIMRPVELAVPHLPPPLPIANPQGKAIYGRDFESGTVRARFHRRTKF